MAPPAKLVVGRFVYEHRRRDRSLDGVRARKVHGLALYTSMPQYTNAVHSYVIRSYAVPRTVHLSRHSNDKSEELAS